MDCQVEHVAIPVENNLQKGRVAGILNLNKESSSLLQQLPSVAQLST